jgi:hypothetical protein
MKHLLLFISILFCFSHTYSKDKIILKGGKKIKGVITHIEDNLVIIQKNKKQLKFTPQQVQYIEFDAQNVELSKIIEQSPDDFTYLDGQQDAQLYHKRFGGNFALGVAFGVFGFIGVAVGNVKDPPVGIPDYQDKINSADYREGYRKKGQGKNLGAAGAGWAVSFLIVILIAVASGG